MEIKKIIVFLILFLSLSNLFGIGLRDWVTITENDTKFRDAGGGTIITLVNRKKYEHPYSWYFYKDNIIGTGRVYLDGSYEYGFFVIDEDEGEIYIFEEEERWNEFIKTNELSPKYWTRWFRGNWDHIEIVKLFALLWFPITIPIIILNVYCYIRLAKSNQSWKKWTALAAITPAIILLINLLGKFPGSV